jgi:hypothetical protein
VNVIGCEVGPPKKKRKDAPFVFRLDLKATELDGKSPRKLNLRRSLASKESTGAEESSANKAVETTKYVISVASETLLKYWMACIQEASQLAEPELGEKEHLSVPSQAASTANPQNAVSSEPEPIADQAEVPKESVPMTPAEMANFDRALQALSDDPAQPVRCCTILLCLGVLPCV